MTTAVGFVSTAHDLESARGLGLIRAREFIHHMVELKSQFPVHTEMVDHRRRPKLSSYSIGSVMRPIPDPFTGPEGSMTGLSSFNGWEIEGYAEQEYQLVKRTGPWDKDHEPQNAHWELVTDVIRLPSGPTVPRLASFADLLATVKVDHYSVFESVEEVLNLEIPMNVGRATHFLTPEKAAERLYGASVQCAWPQEMWYRNGRWSPAYIFDSRIDPYTGEFYREKTITTGYICPQQVYPETYDAGLERDVIQRGWLNEDDHPGHVFDPTPQVSPEVGCPSYCLYPKKACVPHRCGSLFYCRVARSVQLHKYYTLRWVLRELDAWQRISVYFTKGPLSKNIETQTHRVLDQLLLVFFTSNIQALGSIAMGYSPWSTDLPIWEPPRY